MQIIYSPEFQSYFLNLHILLNSHLNNAHPRPAASLMKCGCLKRLEDLKLNETCNILENFSVLIA